MTKGEMIEKIKLLYPADTHETGKELLFKAICDEWESLPEKIIYRYYQLCIFSDKIIFR